MSNGKDDAFAEQEVVIFSSGDEDTIVGPTKPDGKGGLVAIVTRQPEVWDDLMQIDTISGQSNRPLLVLHEDREVILPADGNASDQMRGLKISGRWEIYAELLPGEVMGAPSLAPPSRLRVLVRLSCVNR